MTTLQCSVSGLEVFGSGFSSSRRPDRGVARRCASDGGASVAAGSGEGTPARVALRAAAETARRPSGMWNSVGIEMRTLTHLSYLIIRRSRRRRVETKPFFFFFFEERLRCSHRSVIVLCGLWVQMQIDRSIYLQMQCHLPSAASGRVLARVVGVSPASQWPVAGRPSPCLIESYMISWTQMMPITCTSRA